MLDYTTCKKLKEAGFLQTAVDGWHYVDDFPDNSPIKHRKGDMIAVTGALTYCPTLSELIEACGLPVQDFDLERRFNGMPRWIATLWRDGRYSQGRAEGDTPEEAVANLYLALHPIDSSTL